MRKGRGIKLIDQVNFYFIYTGDLCFLCVIIDYAVIFDIITYTLKDLSFKALSSPQNGTAMLQYHFLLYDHACHSLNDVYSLNKFHSTCGFDTISGGYHCLDRLIILPTNYLVSLNSSLIVCVKSSYFRGLVFSSKLPKSNLQQFDLNQVNLELAHRGRVKLICVSKLTHHWLGNGFSPIRRQASI